MLIHRKTLSPTRLVAVTLLALSLGVTPAFAASKEMIQLQAQIADLQAAVARLQQSNDERMGVLKDLVQQSADSVNRMSLNMDALQKQMRAQQEAQGGKLDQVSTQVQSLNDSLDEMKARVAKLDRAMQDISNQQQAISASVQSLAPGSAAPAGATQTQPSNLPADANPAPASSSDFATPPPTRRGKPSAGVPQADNAAPPTGSPALNAPPVADMYKLAMSDYMSAKYPLASAEFADVIRAYPDSLQAGNSHYYLGEINYRNGHYSQAEKDYDAVIEQFPGNAKIPPAQLHKGQALIIQKQTDAGIREYRSLIARFPNSPEATQARSKLNALGASAATPRR